MIVIWLSMMLVWAAAICLYIGVREWRRTKKLSAAAFIIIAYGMIMVPCAVLLASSQNGLGVPKATAVVLVVLTLGLLACGWLLNPKWLQPAVSEELERLVNEFDVKVKRVLQLVSEAKAIENNTDPVLWAESIAKLRLAIDDALRLADQINAIHPNSPINKEVLAKLHLNLHKDKEASKNTH